MTQSADALRRTVLEVARERFRGVEVVAVTLGDDLGGDEDVVRLNIVVDEGRARLDPGELSAFVRHLRPRLEAIGEARFPIAAFISRTDAERAAADAA